MCSAVSSLLTVDNMCYRATVVTAKIRKKEMVEEGSSEEDNGEEDDSNSVSQQTTHISVFPH